MFMFTVMSIRLILKFELCNEVLIRNITYAEISQCLVRLEIRFNRHKEINWALS